jgi:hypothetical protein
MDASINNIAFCSSVDLIDTASIHYLIEQKPARDHTDPEGTVFSIGSAMVDWCEALPRGLGTCQHLQRESRG